MNDQDRQFREWFHAEYLKTAGPVDPSDGTARYQHRIARGWAKSAWLEARSRALYPDDGSQVVRLVVEGDWEPSDD